MHCKDLITCANEDMSESHNYIDAVNRGSLMHPDSVTTNIVMYNYIIIEKLTKQPHFLHTLNQRRTACKITLDILVNDEINFPMELCEGGHNLEKIVNMIVWASTNTLFNNYCSKENNILAANKANAGKKRKLETLTQSKSGKKQSVELVHTNVIN